MPRKYPSYQTCHRRFKAWHQAGVLQRVMDQLFGEAGDELCSTMEARMRIHAPNAAANDVPQIQPSVPATPLFPQPSTTPVTPLVFNYTSPFKNAA